MWGSNPRLPQQTRGWFAPHAWSRHVWVAVSGVPGRVDSFGRTLSVSFLEADEVNSLSAGQQSPKVKCVCTGARSESEPRAAPFPPRVATLQPNGAGWRSSVYHSDSPLCLFHKRRFTSVADSLTTEYLVGEAEASGLNFIEKEFTFLKIHAMKFITRML